MKKINFLVFLLLSCTLLQAQRREPVNTKKDQRQYEGFTIRLVQAPQRTYGYEVIQGNRRVIYQMQNPFTASPRGLSKKEDAFTVAQYQIKQLIAKKGMSTQRKTATGKGQKLMAGAVRKPTSAPDNETMYNQHFSPKLAEKLKISITE